MAAPRSCWCMTAGSLGYILSKTSGKNLVIDSYEPHAEAMVENQGILTLTTADHTDETYRISIADNGCGIPEEHLNRLFEPYFTDKKTGIGLGLATTLNIVQAHGGQIRVLSEVGNGTQFDVILPK